MFIYAHPDDVDFAAAGTAAKWARGGSEVIYVILTDGNAGSHEPAMTRERLGQIRRAEQEAAAAVVGAKECIFLGYQDGLLGTPDSTADYNSTLNAYKYYCDDLDDITDTLDDVILENRGMFSAGRIFFPSPDCLRIMSILIMESANKLK